MKLEEVLSLGFPFKRPHHHTWIEKCKYSMLWTLKDGKQDCRAYLNARDILADDWIVQKPKKVIYNLYEWLDKSDLGLELTYQFGHWYCQLKSNSTSYKYPQFSKDSKIFSSGQSIAGRGRTSAEAIADFASQIQGKWCHTDQGFNEYVELFTTDEKVLALYLTDPDPMTRKMGEMRVKQLKKK